MNDLLNYLKHIKNGIFIEAGAFDGVMQSNTIMLEAQGWTGFLIEPSPLMSDKCRNSRKQSITINCCLVSNDYIGDTIDGDFELNSPMSSIQKTPNYIVDDIIRDTGIISVPARTFDSIVSEFNITKIDFFSLDVEGCELDVLNGINFTKIRPTYFLIETANKPYYQKIIRDFMSAQGYEYIDSIHYGVSMGKDGIANDDLFIDTTYKKINI
jgi:FkbM family methyltransferase